MEMLGIEFGNILHCPPLGYRLLPGLADLLSVVDPARSHKGYYISGLQPVTL